MSKLRDLIAWAKGQEKVGQLLTIGDECYWEHEVSGFVSCFKKPSKLDLIISPNTKQMSAHIYKVEIVCPKEHEDDHMPWRFYVKQFDIIELSKLDEWKEQLTKYPYL